MSFKVQIFTTLDIHSISHVCVLQKLILEDTWNSHQMFILLFTILYKILKIFRLVLSCLRKVYTVFFSKNVNVILFFGSKNANILYKVPDILLQQQMKDIKNTYARYFYNHLNLKKSHLRYNCGSFFAGRTNSELIPATYYIYNNIFDWQPVSAQNCFSYLYNDYIIL